MAKRRTAQNTYYLVNLGCSKNAVDAASMAQLLDESGMTALDQARHAEVLIVNTCGFINAAKAESLQTLRELARHKRPDQYLIAAGCMAQRYGRRACSSGARAGWRDRHAPLDGYPRFDRSLARAQTP